MADETQKQQQGPKEGHEDQGKHLGQQKQAAGEIGKDAPHGKSGAEHVEDEEETTEETGTDEETGL